MVQLFVVSQARLLAGQSLGSACSRVSECVLDVDQMRATVKKMEERLVPMDHISDSQAALADADAQR